MINDMIVAVEDLRSVEFTLIPVEKRAKKTTSAMAKSGKPRGGGGGALSPAAAAPESGATPSPPLVTCSVSSYPLPRVTGSRSHLKGMPT